MSHTPPVPQGNQSPYPIQEPPHVPAAALPPVAHQEKNGSRAKTVAGWPLAAIGAAVGLGAAVIGGVVWGRRRGAQGKRT